MKAKLISLAILALLSFNVSAQDAAADLNPAASSKQQAAQWPMPL